MKPLKWNHYLACFFAGFWGVNVLPHLLHGISGQAFPTPFASPPFQGLSSPLVNTTWALVNIVLAYWLARVGRLSPERPLTMWLFLLGFAVLALFMAYASALMPSLPK